MSEWKKTQALLKKYAKAGIQLTEAEKNRIAYLKKQYETGKEVKPKKRNG